jgi:hypothetical protein
MRLPNIDYLLDDCSSIALAHRHYLDWIDNNLEENRLERRHFSPYQLGKFTQHACECDYLLCYQRGSSLTLSRLNKRLPEAMKELYGCSIVLPDIFVFVGETSSAFSVDHREGACAIMLDFRMAMILALSEFFVGLQDGTVRSRQLATWLMLAVVRSREIDFDWMLIELAHEANATNPRVFGDLIGRVADLVILHELGHVIADQLPADFTHAGYKPRESMGVGSKKRRGAGFVPDDPVLPPPERPIPEVHPRLALPAEIEHWHPEIVADCFSIFAGFAVCLEVYDGDRRKAIEAICDSFLGWNITFFALWSLQYLKLEAVGSAGEIDSSSHPDGLTRCDLALHFINHLMSRTYPEYRSPALGRSVDVYRKLWSGPMEEDLKWIKTYLLYVPEAFQKFTRHALKGALVGCLYDEFKDVPGGGRLMGNIEEVAKQWDAFHKASHVNDIPVFINMANKLDALEITYISEDRT